MTEPTIPAGYLVYIRDSGQAFPQKIAYEMYAIKLGGSEKYEYQTVYNREIEKYPLDANQMKWDLNYLTTRFPMKGKP